MKRPYTLLLAAAFTAICCATDRVVSRTGTYNTISSAVAASSDGDRVLVESGTYNEFVHLNRSISLLPLVEGERYTLTERLTISHANGAQVLISGANGEQLLYVGFYTTSTTVRVVDSFFQQCDLVDPQIRVELFRDTVRQYAAISSGMVVGCSFPGANGGVFSLSVIGSTTSTDEVVVIGNNFGSISGDSDLFLSTNSSIRMENNLIRSERSPAISIVRSGPVPGATTYMLNNTVRTNMVDGGGAFACGVLGDYPQNMVVKNNAVINYNGGFLGPLPQQVAISQSNDLVVPPSAVDPGSGAPTAGSPLIDAGDPDPRYLDLDLTRNDVGCYGGSNSRANFTTPMGGAVVGFMQAPRVVSQGDAVNISATGFDR
jgi:hypothetical protein